MALPYIKHLFTQVLQDGKCHWVTASTVGCKANEVKYFDGLAGPSIKAKISKQIANLLKTNSNNITIHMMPVQQQLNNADCGVLAVAFAISLLFGSCSRNFSPIKCEKSSNQVLKKKKIHTISNVTF